MKEKAHRRTSITRMILALLTVLMVFSCPFAYSTVGTVSSSNHFSNTVSSESYDTASLPFVEKAYATSHSSQSNTSNSSQSNTSKKSNDADSGGNLGWTSLIEIVKWFVTWIMLPIGILLAAWNLIYYAIVVGMISIDPLNKMSGGRGAYGSGSDSGWSYDDVQKKIKESLVGFGKGLILVGGIFAIFQLCMTLASMAAGLVMNGFG